jgi:ribose transport system substrate-binding protein
MSPPTVNLRPLLTTRSRIAKLAAMAGAALVVGMFAASGSAAPSKASSTLAPRATKYTIAVTVNVLNSPYPAAQIAHTKQLCTKYQLKCIILDPNLNAVTQASQVESAITQHVNAVLYFPVNIKTARPILLKLKAAKIPVVNWGSRVVPSDRGLVVSYTGENSTYEGNAMGKQLCKDAAGKSTTVAVVTGLPGSGATVQRTDGFNQAIRACPNVKVVASEPGNFDQATALTVSNDMLQSHPDVNAIYAEDDIMGLGAIQAVQTAGLTGKVNVYGIGAERQFVAAIKAGTARATVAQDPWSYAAAGINAVRAVLAGKHIPTFIPIAMPVITKANAGSYVSHW